MNSSFAAREGGGGWGRYLQAIDKVHRSGRPSRTKRTTFVVKGTKTKVSIVLLSSLGWETSVERTFDEACEGGDVDAVGDVSAAAARGRRRKSCA